MFLSNNFKYPLLPIVSALNFNTRLINLTSRNCIRGKPVKYTEPVAEFQYSERETERTPCELNSNVNFFGIDGDEGVIIIGSKNSENIVNPNNINRKSREKYFRSSFGVIRQDLDNKIRFHGQYESAIDSSFPHKSTDIAEVSGEFRQIESNLFQTSRNNKSDNKLKSNDNNNYSFIKAYSTKDSHLNSVYNDVEEEKIGNLESSFHKDEVQDKCSLLSSINERKVDCIDESLFDGVHEKDNYIKCDETSDHHKECSSYVSSSDLKSGPYTDLTIGKSNLPSQPNENHINCIEKYFFPNVHENNGSLKTQSAAHSDVEELSFLDENYFGNILKDKKISGEEKCPQNAEISNDLPSDGIAPDVISQYNFLHDLSSVNDTEYCTNESNKSNFAEDTKLHTSHKSKDTSFAEIFPLISVKDTVSKHQVSEKSSYNRGESHFSNLNSVEKKIAFNKNFNDISETRYVLNKQDSPCTLDDYVSNTRKSYPGVQQLLKYDHMDPNSGVSELVTNLNSDIRVNNISHNLEMPKSTNKTEFSESNDVYTAHSFVMELRKKQELESEKSQEGVSTSTSKKAEKFDSKGFRILKNQVPDLSHFTREEVLNMLKGSVVYSDDNLLILNKPYSLVMHDSQTTKSPCLSLFLDDLAKELDQQAADPKLFTVHRLDKETTGCVLLARNEITAQNLKSFFAERKIIKKYWIVTSRVPDPLKGIIDIPVSEGSIHGKKRMVLHPDIPKDVGYKSHSRNGKRAVTSYKVLCISGNAALVEAVPETGIKHQIRVHFGFGLSCPILGDHKYSHMEKLAPQKLASDLLQRLHVRQSKVRYIPMHIHSKSITIPNYLDGRDLFVMAPLPSHMLDNLKKLKFKKKNQLFL